MVRKIIIALAATAALGLGFAPTDASARAPHGVRSVHAAHVHHNMRFRHHRHVVVRHHHFVRPHLRHRLAVVCHRPHWRGHRCCY